MASGSFKQPKTILVSSKKIKPKSQDNETKKPSKGVKGTVSVGKKGWALSDDGVIKQ